MLTFLRILRNSENSILIDINNINYTNLMSVAQNELNENARNP